VLSRANLAYALDPSSLNFRPFNLLQPLGSRFSRPTLCFQQLADSFRKIPGVGLPVQSLAPCTEPQRGRFLSPLVAAVTHFMSRKSFVCHSYENTRDAGMGVTSASASPAKSPSHALRGASIPYGLSRLRILLVTTGVCVPSKLSPCPPSPRARSPDYPLSTTHGSWETQIPLLFARELDIQ
jgi:hypothetical protein